MNKQLNIHWIIGLWIFTCEYSSHYRHDTNTRVRYCSPSKSVSDHVEQVQAVGNLDIYSCESFHELPDSPQVPWGISGVSPETEMSAADDSTTTLASPRIHTTELNRAEYERSKPSLLCPNWLHEKLRNLQCLKSRAGVQWAPSRPAWLDLPINARTNALP